MSAQREYPVGGGPWRYNAETFERSRLHCAQEAGRAEKAGDKDRAEHYRELAEAARHERDRTQRRAELTALNRSNTIHRKYHH